MSEQDEPSSFDGVRPSLARYLTVAAIGCLVGAITVLSIPESTPEPHAHGPTQQTATTYTCAMHPQIRQQQPGQCPICGMDLVPVGGVDGEPSATEVVLSERAKNLARLRTTEVVRRAKGSGSVRLLGSIVPDERTRKTVTAWTHGRIDSLKVRTTGERVRAGQIIATLYSPEIYAAHQDLLVARRQLLRMAQAATPARLAAEATLAAARDRLLLLGVSNDEVAQMERATQPRRQVPIRSPFSGTVIERIASEGAYVQTGSALYRIANLSRLWVELDAYEEDLPFLSVGQQVEIEVQGSAGAPFVGRVEFIDPTVDRVRRTAKVRVEVANRDGSLRPGMFVQAQVETGGGEEGAPPPLVVPASAPLFTGRRSLVYVEVPGRGRPTYEARTVRLGPRMGSYYPVVAGLVEGERVVTRGAFVLDADLQIRGGDSMMRAPDDTMRGDDTMLQVPHAELEVLAPVMNAYLAIQESLAGDDLTGARKNARELAGAARAARLDKPVEARGAWAQLSEAFVAHAQALADAPAIENARGEFEQLSELSERLLARFGNPLDAPLWVAYCPMALGSEGAYWVQRSETIHNSYFGAQMQECGELRESVPAGNHMMSDPGTLGGTP